MNKRRDLIHIVPSNKWGGVQTYALDICRHYISAGWHVAAVTQNAVRVDTPFAEAGVQLIHAPLGGVGDLSSILTLADTLRRIPAGSHAVVHVHRYRDALTAAAARRLARRPEIKIVSTRHAVRRGRRSFIFRWIYRAVDTHLFVSKLARDTFMTPLHHHLPCSPLVPDNKCAILRNSLYLTDFTPTPVPDSGPITALYVGAVVNGKGLENLIDAFALLRGVKLRLRICGPADPDYADLLRRRAMSRSVMESIDWNIGAAPAPEICHSAHFAVIPSSESEAFGLNNLMMMAAGRAQITTTNGAQTEYLTPGVTALMVPPEDPEALAAAIRTLATDHALRKAMGENARREYNTRLAWQNFTDSLDKIYGA